MREISAVFASAWFHIPGLDRDAELLPFVVSALTNTELRSSNKSIGDKRGN